MDEAIRQIEKSNIDLEPEVMDAHAVRELLSRYAKAKKLVSYGETMLAAKLGDAGDGGANHRSVCGQGQGRGRHGKLLEVGRRSPRGVQIGRDLCGPSLRDRHGGERLARLLDRAIEAGPG